MGRKSNYFRHSFEAHNDLKIQKLMDEGGLKAVGSYFILLEIYGREVTDNEIDLTKSTVVSIHIRRIATALRLRSDSARTALELLANCRLIDPLNYQSDSSTIQLSIPNFLKYFGSYKKTVTKKGPNKIKGNKIKEKEIKDNIVPPKNTIRPDDILVIWNDQVIANGKKIPIAKAINDRRRKKINSCVKEYQEMQSLEDWKNYFQKINTTPFLTGQNPRGWRCDFDWCIDKNNLIKICEGRYDDAMINHASKKENDILNMQNPFS